MSRTGVSHGSAAVVAYWWKRTSHGQARAFRSASGGSSGRMLPEREQSGELSRFHRPRAEYRRRSRIVISDDEKVLARSREMLNVKRPATLSKQEPHSPAHRTGRNQGGQNACYVRRRREYVVRRNMGVSAGLLGSPHVRRRYRRRPTARLVSVQDRECDASACRRGAQPASRARRPACSFLVTRHRLTGRL